MILLSASIYGQLNTLLAVSGLILILGLLLKKLNQPYIVAYILTGVILGPFGLGVVTHLETAEIIGEFGLVILMFFIGMEISLPNFLKQWRVAVFGTGLQIVFSVLLMLLMGSYLGWSTKRVVLIGFIISISSSAVVMKLLEDGQISKTKIGQHIISILLTQDVAIVPMIIIMSFLGSGEIQLGQIGLQLLGGGMIIALLVYLMRKKTIKLPLASALLHDHELQVFAGLIVCFSLALFTSFFELSAGLGAFVAGLFVHSSTSTKWLHDTLNPFRVVLISIFFLSVGMLIDLNFLTENWRIILLMVLGVFLSNQGINALLLKLLGNSWKESIYGGALLAQIGEFSFILSSLGYHANLISLFSYQLTIIVISITIFISPMWALVTAKTLKVTRAELEA